jgi:hypothetical protein
MFPIRNVLLACAFTSACFIGLVRAGETPGELACHRKPTTVGFRSCYDPCEPVGPIRRFFRQVFRVPCPPPRPVMVPIVAAPACPPATFNSAPLPGTLPAAPPVDVGRPVPVNPPLDVPPPSPPAPVSGFGNRQPQAPVAPPAPRPVPLDRLASRSGTPVVRAAAPEEPTTTLLLVSMEKTGVRLNASVDARGQFTHEIPEGEWLVYSREADGRLTYRGKVASRMGVAVKSDLP